ncbi:MAG: hypothetical protein Q9214_007608, partial [Letrouitia sp. 1 TL-2023]
MVAIHTSVDEVVRHIDSLMPSSDSLEIACYNSQASHVVSSSEPGVARLSSSLRKDIKQTKLDVSYGFHSVLFDPILEELAGVAKRLRFHEAEIPIAACTEEAIRTIDASRLVRHTREPVWFCNAVQRIEKGLDECVWLEAGMGSSIIPMVKRASADPAHHCFVNLTPRSSQDGMLQLAEITRTLWSQGFSPTHWPFHPMPDTAPRHIWLPPYQFEKTRHWIPYVDNAMRILSERPTNGTKTPDQNSHTLPETLITSCAEGKFSINIACEYYQNLVSSHAVLGKPLCPASMYLECATMAVQSIEERVQGKSLSFKDLTIDAPL